MEIEIHCGDPDWEKPKEEEVNSHSQLVQPEPACKLKTSMIVTSLIIYNIAKYKVKCRKRVDLYIYNVATCGCTWKLQRNNGFVPWSGFRV